MATVINSLYKLLREDPNYTDCELWLSEDLYGETLQIYLVRMERSPALRHHILMQRAKEFVEFSHPSIVGLKDYGYDDAERVYYFVYYPASGIPLNQYIKSGSIGSQRILQTLTQLVDTLSTLHAQNLAHSKLTPESVIYPRSDNANVMLNRVGLNNFLSILSQNTPVTGNIEHSKQEDLNGVAEIVTRVVRAMPKLPQELQTAFKELAVTIRQSNAERLTAAGILRKLRHLQRSIANTGTVCVGLTTRAVTQMYEYKLIQENRDYLAYEFLQQEFARDVYGWSRERPPSEKKEEPSKDGKKRERQGRLYRLTTAQVRLSCAPDDRSNPPTHLVVTGVNFVDSSDIAGDMDNGLLIQEHLEAAPIDRIPEGSSVVTLLQSIDQHVSATTQQTQIEVTAKNSLRLWDTLLGVQQNQLQSFRLAYDGFTIVDGGAALAITFESPVEAEKVTLSADNLLQLTNEDGRQTTVGLFEDLSGGVIKIGLVKNVDVSALQQRGVLTMDNVQAGAVVRRQRDAIKRLRYGETVHPNLLQLLLQPATITIGNPADVEDWEQKKLDSTQRKAVRRALATQDLFMIHGPPGTGKTAIIAELVLQILRGNPTARILVASQSNVAVNHALNGIIQLKPDLAEHIVRVGREEKAGLTEHLLIDRQLQTWRDRVIQQSDAFMCELQERVEGNQDVRLAYGYVSGCREFQRELVTLQEQLPAVASQLSQIEAMYLQLEQAIEQQAALRAQLDTLGRGVHPDDDRLRQALRLFEGQYLNWAEQFLTQADAVMQLSERNVATRERKQRLQTRIQIVQDEIEVRRLLIADIVRGQFGKSIESISEQQAFLDTYFAALSDEARRFGLLKRVADDWRALFGKDVAGFMPAYLSRCRIIGATCIGIAARSDINQMMFDWVIIDEAGRATHPELLVPIVRGSRIVLVGDHHQLPPTIDQSMLEAIDEIGEIDRRDLETTLFQELIEQVQHTVKVQLDVQYRMHPAIGRLISDCFYEGKLNAASVTEQKQHSLDWCARPVIWYSTQSLASRDERRSGSSFRNEAEIDLVLALLERLNTSYENMPLERPKTVGVITGYSAQKAAIRQRVAARNWSSSIEIEVDTVDAYQGRERDVIIYSIVRSNPEGKIGFLRDGRRLNVALSRACELLIVVGNDRVEFADVRSSNPFRSVLQHIRTHADDCCLEVVQP